MPAGVSSPSPLPQPVPSLLTPSMGERRAEDKPKRSRWSRRNLRWESEFEYFDYTASPPGNRWFNRDKPKNLAIRLIVKIGDNVPMPFEDIHHLEAVIDIAEEDHIVFVRHAAQVRAEFRPGASQRTGQSSQMVTVVAQLPNEALRYRHAAAHASDIA